MNDTISKLAVIQIIEKMRARIGHNLERSVGRAMIEILDEIGEDVEKLPSVLGTNLAEVGTDCISKQDAIVTAVRAAIDWHKLANPQYSIAYCIGEAMRQLPSVEPQIIRCKDCKHWMPYEWMFSEVWQSQNIDDYPEDEIGCNLCDVHMKASDFCSRAERREVTT